MLPGCLGEQSDVILVFANGGSYIQWLWLEEKGLPHRVYPDLRESVIEECFAQNQERLRKKKELVRFLCIFDDSLDKGTVNNVAVRRIFQHGRIHMIQPVVLQQSLSQIETTWKRNTDVWFMFQPRTFNDRIWAYENVLSDIVETKQEAMELMRSLPEHTCMVIDYSSGTTEFRLWKPPLVEPK